MSANVWSPNPNVVPQANVQATMQQERQTAAVGQRQFNLTKFAYAPNTGSILVFRNGKALDRNIDFFEVDGASLIMADAAAQNDVLSFVGFTGVTATATTDAVLRADITASSGANIIGAQVADNAFATTVAEIFARRINAYDYMTPAQREDFLTGNPQLDHSSAANLAIAAAGGYGRVEFPRKKTGVWRFDTTITVGGSNTTDSNVTLDFEPGCTAVSYPAAINTIIFLYKNIPGHFNLQGLKNLKITSMNAKGVGIKFNGQCFGHFENLYFEGFNCGFWITNEGNSVFNEFIRFNNIELHLNNTAILLQKDGDVGGTDTSMHGLSFRNTTINCSGANRVGIQTIDICWYNGDADLKFFSDVDSQAIIKMSTSGTTYNKGVFISGSLTCEGVATVTGTGRFYLKGDINFDQGLTDTLSSPDAWEQGLLANNYVKARAYGTSGYTVSNRLPLSGQYGTTGPIGSILRLSKSGVDSIIVNCYDAHANSEGNGLWVGYTGYQKNFDDGGTPGTFISSDGTEISSKNPTLSTQMQLKHNAQIALRFDGQSRPNTTEGFFLGSGGAAKFSGIGAPEGVVTASVGSTYARRDGGTTTTLYVKESGSGNTGWIAK